MIDGFFYYGHGYNNDDNNGSDSFGDGGKNSLVKNIVR